MKCIPKLVKFTLIILFSFSMLFGFYTTTHRSASILKFGQFSTNIGYYHSKLSDNLIFNNTIKLMTVDVRAGLLPFMDIGLIRTFDFSDYGDVDSDGMDTYWIDTKLQLSNLNNKNYLPQLSLGYGFGDLISDDDKDDKYFVNSLYLILGIPTEIITPYYSFRFEYSSDELKWLPNWAWEEDWDMIRKAHIIGFEINAIDFVKPIVEFGRFYYNDFSDGLNVITAGVNFYLDIPKLLSPKQITTTE